MIIQFRLIKLFPIFMFLLVSCVPSLNAANLETKTETSKINTPIISTPNIIIAPLKLTPTNLTTVTEFEREKFIRNKYQYNDECKFPCFWGIMPGRDSIDSVITRFSSYADFEDRTEPNDIMQHFVMTIYPPNELDYFSEHEWKITLGVQDGLVKTLASSGAYTNIFGKKDIGLFLRDLENPKEIWVMANTGMGDSPWYSMLLYYPNKSIIVGWKGSVKIIEDIDNKRAFTICPTNFINEIDMILYVPPYFFSWTPNENIPFSELNKNYFADEPFILLSNKNSDVDVEKFYETYINTDMEKCFIYTN